MDSRTWIVVGAAALFGLIGIVYAFIRHTETKLEGKVDAIAEQQSKNIERLAKLETKVERLETEVDSLRKRFHDTLDDAKRLMWDVYEEFKAEVRRLIGK